MDFVEIIIAVCSDLPFNIIIIITKRIWRVLIIGHNDCFVITGHNDFFVITGHNDFLVMTGHNDFLVMTGHNDPESHKTQVRLRIPQD